MFTGIGGFELGIQKGSKEEWKCVGYSEINKYAIRVFERHFKEIKNYGDCKTINSNELPDFNLLVGGFPCQSFSMAGKRRGFEDTRGTLFFDICRIIKDKKPQFLLLENVKGLLSHDEGKTFATIISSLDELGYYVEWQVLNSKHFGVPQNRERVFIMGYIRGETRPKIFPLTKTTRTDYEEKQIRRCDIGKERNKLNNNETRCDNDTRITDFSNNKDFGISDNPITIALSNLNKQGRLIHNEGYVGTLQTSGMGDYGIQDKEKIRRLTPVECERLQGFPDNWTKGLSDAQRYKCLGNAVTVNVIEAIFMKWMQNE